MISTPRTFACPNCGAELEAKLATTKLVACSYCDSNVLLEDDAVKLAGKQGVMADYPSLVQMHGNYRYRGWQFMAVGRARFDYGQGFWDEWWVVGGDGEGRWLSVDEGDFALEEPVDIERTPSPFELAPGSRITIKGRRALRYGKGSRYMHRRSGRTPGGPQHRRQLQLCPSQRSRRTAVHPRSRARPC